MPPMLDSVTVSRWPGAGVWVSVLPCTVENAVVHLPDEEILATEGRVLHLGLWIVLRGHGAA